MEKYRERLTTFVLLLFAIFFVFVIGCVLAYPQSSMVHFSVFSLLLGLILFFSISCGLYLFFKRIDFKRIPIFPILFVLFIIIQCFVAYHIAVSPTWDFGAVYQAVVDDIHSVTKLYHNHYFYMFPNNIMLAYILKGFFLPFHMIGFHDYVLIGVFFNIICIDISIFFLYKIVRLIFPKMKPVFFYLALLFFLPFITYAPIFYTDTVILPFLTIPLYCFISFIICSEMNRKSLVLAILSGILLGIGLQVKFTIIILLIAFCSFFILQEDWKSKWKMVLFVFLGVIIVTIPIKFVFRHLFDQDVMEKSKVPITHWIMMGLQGHGEFNYKDYSVTFEAGDLEAKKDANMKIIKKRIDNMVKRHNILSFYAGKISFLWSDGTYYAPELLRESLHKNWFQKFFLTNGKYYSIFSYLSQIQHLFMLIMILCSLLFSKYLDSTERKIRNFLLITVLGVILFFIIWEVSSRYLYHMLPVLLIASFLGCEAVFRFIFQSLKCCKEKYYEKNREKIKL